jgi:hypothetical protein
MKRKIVILTLAVATCLLGLVAGPASAQNFLDPITGVWANHVQGMGDSQWTFTPLGNGLYRATEAGLGAATGTARLTGTHLHIDYTFAGGAGVYDVDLSADFTGGTGTTTHTQGPTRGSTWTVAFTKVPRIRGSGSGSTGSTGPAAPVLVRTMHTHMRWTRLDPGTGLRELVQTDGDTYVYGDGSSVTTGVVSAGDPGMRAAGWIATDLTVSG